MTDQPERTKVRNPDNLGVRYASLMVPLTVFRSPNGTYAVPIMLESPTSPGPPRVHVMVPVEQLAQVARDLKAARKKGLELVAQADANANGDFPTAEKVLPADVLQGCRDALATLIEAYESKPDAKRYEIEVLLADSHPKKVAELAGNMVVHGAQHELARRAPFELGHKVARMSRYWKVTITAQRAQENA